MNVLTMKQKGDEMNGNLESLLALLLRPRRACSISRLLMLAFLRSGEEVSSLALERRMRGVGVVNPRMVMRADDGFAVKVRREDGVYWRITGRGREELRKLERFLRRDGVVPVLRSRGGAGAESGLCAEGVDFDC